jgi:hypothetical protein
MISTFYPYAIVGFSPVPLLIFALTNKPFSMLRADPSTALKEFEELLESDIPASGVRWETIGTPEYTGGFSAR